MHDVLKATTPEQKQRPRIRWVRSILFLILFVAALAGLVLNKTATMLVVIAAITGFMVWFALISLRRFRSSRPMSGAVFAVLAVFLVLMDVKALQFRAMAAMGAQMAPPPTTVTSVMVKEEDWPPILSAVGSISPVQGAIVSTELGGVVAEINFQNGGEAKKGDVLVRLDATAEDAD